ncbi:MAG: hypothetical protein JXL97_01405 [Bacteroidales bacterium]|nr:hypothetical protein [Bacteroidales bacterium]
MATQIKTISDGSIIEFDSGLFDEWCVYLKRNGENRTAPRDVQYFAELQGLAKKYTSKKLYDDFLRIYSATDSKINEQVLNRITQISKDYGEDEIIVDIWLTVLYAGMVAEENKKYAILKKRIKRLGMYQVLIENRTPGFAANFSKGKKWRELDGIMKKYGF